MDMLQLNQLVQYRYGSCPLGHIKDIDRINQRLLLDVNDRGETFTRWVHATSVRPVTSAPASQPEQLPLLTDTAA